MNAGANIRQDFSMEREGLIEPEKELLERESSCLFALQRLLPGTVDSRRVGSV
jgi:hypothetical protein